MFNFFASTATKKPIINGVELQTFRPQVVGLTTDERAECLRVFTAIPGTNDQKVLSSVFTKYAFAEGESPYPYYKILYEVERLILEWEDNETKDLKIRLSDLEAAAKTKGGKKYLDDIDSEIQECTKVLNEKIMMGAEKRKQLYQGFFKFLNKKYNDKPEEMERILNELTATKPRILDPINERVRNPLVYYQSIRKDNEAYATSWYMIGFGILTTVIGLTFLTVSLVTGLFPSMLVVFGFLSAIGVAMAWMGGNRASRLMLAYKASPALEASLYSQKHTVDAIAYRSEHTSSFGWLNWKTAPFIVLGLALFAVVIADFYLGGPLSAMGHALEIVILPGYILNIPDISIPNVSVPILGDYILNPFLNYLINPIITTVFQAITSPFATSAALDFVLIGIIGSVGLGLLGTLTRLLKSKTATRMHQTISQSYTTALTTYSLCGGIGLLFASTAIPMMLLPFAGLIFAICMYNLIKGNPKFVQDLSMTPAMLGGGPGKTKTYDFKTGALYSAVAIVCCAVTAFALISNPITFSVAFLVLAIAVGLGKDQIFAFADKQNKKSLKQHMATEMQSMSKNKTLEPSPVLAAVSKENMAIKEKKENDAKNNSSSTSTGYRPSQPVASSGSSKKPTTAP